MPPGRHRPGRGDRLLRPFGSLGVDITTGCFTPQANMRRVKKKRKGGPIKLVVPTRTEDPSNVWFSFAFPPNQPERKHRLAWCRARKGQSSAKTGLGTSMFLLVHTKENKMRKHGAASSTASPVKVKCMVGIQPLSLTFCATWRLFLHIHSDANKPQLNWLPFFSCLQTGNLQDGWLFVWLPLKPTPSKGYQASQRNWRRGVSVLSALLTPPPASTACSIMRLSRLSYNQKAAASKSIDLEEIARQSEREKHLSWHGTFGGEGLAIKTTEIWGIMYGPSTIVEEFPTKTTEIFMAPRAAANYASPLKIA